MGKSRPAVRQGARAPRLRPRCDPPRGDRLPVLHPSTLRAHRPDAVHPERRPRALRRGAQMHGAARQRQRGFHLGDQRVRVRRKPGTRPKRRVVAHAPVRHGAAAQDGGNAGGGGRAGGGGGGEEGSRGRRVRTPGSAPAPRALARRAQGYATGDRAGQVPKEPRPASARHRTPEDADNGGEPPIGARGGGERGKTN